MSSLIRPEDLDGSPRDDIDAFIHLEQLARDRHKDAVDELLDRYGNGVDTGECDFAYMRAVLAAANACGIDDLTNWSLPRYGEEEWSRDCRNFRATAEFVAVKLLIQQSRRRDTYSIALDTATKLKLQHYVQQGRDLIAEADLTLPKRERLLACLNAFQVELHRERTGLQVFGALACELASYASEAADKGERLVRVIERIGNALGLARQAEDERERGKRLPAPDRKRIEAPKQTKAPKRPVFDKKIDDEIPF